jgi:hypothetical protein
VRRAGTVSKRRIGGSPSSADYATGRDARGRFTQGNAGGPGNPFARRTAQLRQALCQTVTEEDIVEVTRKLVERAKAGDVPAARLLLAYTIGQPAPAIDPDKLDIEEGDIHRRTPMTMDSFCRFLAGKTPPSIMCQLLDALVAPVAPRAARVISAVLGHDDAALAAMGIDMDPDDMDPDDTDPDDTDPDDTDPDDTDPDDTDPGDTAPPPICAPRRRPGASGRPSPIGRNGRTAAPCPPSPNGDNGKRLLPASRPPAARRNSKPKSRNPRLKKP